VGEPPKKVLEEVETVKFVVYGFKDREEKRRKVILSPVLKAYGYQWNSAFYPRGDSNMLERTITNQPPSSSSVAKESTLHVGRLY